MEAMKTKRSSLLLELIIAISLLVIGLVGLIKSPAYLHRAQARAFEKAECERLAAWTFTEIREQFAQGELAWSTLPPLEKTSQAIELPSFIINGRKINQRYFLTTLEQKQTVNGTIYRLIAVCIQQGKHKFTYRIAVEKRAL